MYSGTTLTRFSGRLFGAHQKVDRVAHAHLRSISGGAAGFPAKRAILHFEGKNGPDAIKRKSPAQDEPWHYYDPFDEDDSGLLELIEHHYYELVRQLQSGNCEKAAFEAAWLAHAIADGLTPAHHFPYEQKLEELRGQAKETRTTLRQKLLMPGSSPKHFVLNNWKMWGPKGLFTTHGLFELGMTTIMAPLRLQEARPTQLDLDRLQVIGPLEWFKHTARRIALLKLYDRYYDRGWTRKLASLVRKELAPEVVRTVTLFWYSALREAEVALEPIKSES